MARIGRFASTTAFKLSAIYLTVFSVFAVVFAGSITLAANQLLNQQVIDAIESELLDLADEWNNNGGQVGLINAIAERGRRPGASLYLLVDFTGEILAGNVSQVSTDLLAQATMAPTQIDYQTEEGECLRNDKDYMYVAAWEYKGPGDFVLHKEPLVFENVEFATRSYK